MTGWEASTMRTWKVVPLFVLMWAVSASAGDKQKGTATLKDLQPTGGTDKKTHKNQQYDFTFDAGMHEYTCRTQEKTKLNATDFIVGSTVSYQIDSNKAKLKGSSGKETKCTVVRVEDISNAPTAPK
jgi:hypothetical protein